MGGICLLVPLGACSAKAGSEFHASHVFGIEVGCPDLRQMQLGCYFSGDAFAGLNPARDQLGTTAGSMDLNVIRSKVARAKAMLP